MSLFQSIARHIEQEDTFLLATVIAGPESVGDKAIFLPDGIIEGHLPEPVCEQIVADFDGIIQGEARESRVFQADGREYEVFLDVYTPAHQIIIVGGVETAQALTRLAKELGYRVIVTDARAAFAAETRFPEADRVIKGWPQDVLPMLRLDDSTYLVLLSHDPKFDEPTLRHVLPLPVRYIGAIGSRRTQAQRRERLISEGFSQAAVDRIHGPVGLDLGGRSAAETALSILAEITAVRYDKTGAMMKHKP